LARTFEKLGQEFSKVTDCKKISKLMKVGFLFSIVALSIIALNNLLPNSSLQENLVHGSLTNVGHQITVNYTSFTGGGWWRFTISAASTYTGAPVYTAAAAPVLVWIPDGKKTLLPDSLYVSFQETLQYELNFVADAYQENYWGKFNERNAIFTIGWKWMTPDMFNKWQSVQGGQLEKTPYVFHNISWIIRNRLPELTFIAGPSGVFKGNYYTWSAIGGDPDGDEITKYQWMIDGIVQSSNSSSLTMNWPASSTPSFGEHTISVKAADQTGAYGPSTKTTFQLMRSAPTLTGISGPSSGPGGTYIFYATCSDIDKDYPITYSWLIDGRPQTTGIVSTNTGSSITIPLVSPKTIGLKILYNIEVIATNYHRSSSSKSMLFTCTPTVYTIYKGNQSEFQTNDTQNIFTYQNLAIGGVATVTVLALAAVITIRKLRAKDKNNSTKTGPGLE
jgi:hypothetical protein